VGLEDERRRHSEISRALDGLRDSGRAAGALELSARAGFAPVSTIAAAARLATLHRSFNLMVTNVPGPQEPRHLLGRRLRSIYPALPLAPGQALSIAVISYAGRLCFGLLSDYDALADPELLAGFLAESLAELPPRAAGNGLSRSQPR
jgi:diacylglycerol O-acyltransferase